MKYTQVPANAFENLQLNAGILVDDFNPATGVIGNILGATTGGLTFASNPTYTDFGEDVDNVPANTKQLKKITSYDPSISGTLLTVTDALAAKLSGAADFSSNKITPRSELTDADFDDMWIVGDYSDKNTGANAGFVAIHLMNALNTTGFQLKTSKNGKGNFSFEFHGHYDIEDIDTVPYEIYVKAGTGTVTPSISLNTHSFSIADEATQQLVATTVPAGSTVSWNSANTSVASVSGGLVTGEGSGNTIITASITQDGVTYSDTCTVIVT